MKQIEKVSFENMIRQIRRLYKRYQNGEINSTTFASRSAKLVWGLRNEQIRETIYATGVLVEAELKSYQAQFGLDLEFETYIYYQRGLRAEVQIRQGNTVYSGIFIGPKQQWDKIAAYQPGDEKFGFWGPNFYTKRMAKRWKSRDEFDFPTFMQRLKEHIEDRKRIEIEGDRREAAGLPRDREEDIPF